MLLHDKAGNNAIVAMTLNHPPGAEAGATQFYADSPAWWTNIADPLANAQSSLLGGEQGTPRVVCTSAGQTTRLVVGLVETAVPLGGGGSGVDGEAAVGSTARRRDTKFELVAAQDGSILSGTQGSSIHLRIHRAKEKLLGTPSTATVEASNDGLSRPDPNQLALNVDSIPVALHVQITGGGGEVGTMPLEVLTADGILLSLPGKMGTVPLSVCLLELRTAGGGGSVEGGACLAEAVVILEIFSPEKYIVRLRPSSEAAVHVRPASMLNMAGSGRMEGMDEDSNNKVKPDAIVEKTRVAFIVDLQKVDGYKLSTLHLMRHLPDKFRASALDLSCACEQCMHLHFAAIRLRSDLHPVFKLNSYTQLWVKYNDDAFVCVLVCDGTAGELPVKDILDEAGVELIRICLKMPRMVSTVESVPRRSVVSCTAV